MIIPISFITNNHSNIQGMAVHKIQAFYKMANHIRVIPIHENRFRVPTAKLIFPCVLHISDRAECVSQIHTETNIKLDPLYY